MEKVEHTLETRHRVVTQKIEIKKTLSVPLLVILKVNFSV